MKRLSAILLLFALLALPACGRAGAAIVTTMPTTTEIETTTEEPTEEEITRAELVAVTDPNETGWRTPMELALSETITVYEVFSTYHAGLESYDIWMRDSKTGEDKLLLGMTYDEYGLVAYTLEGRVSERYFAFSEGTPDTDAFSEVKFYDIAQRRVVEIHAPGYKMMFKKVENGRVYLHNEPDYDENADELPEFYFDIAALDSGGPIIPKEVR
jgi:predicted small lipoprotein YifL